MANVLEILIQATDKASKELDSISDSCQKMSGQLKAVGVAMTAVGVAGLKMVGDARKMNAELGQIALTAGTSTEEMRKLALEVTNVTFSLDAVIGTFDVLARAGITNTEQMKKAANAFDALADATGSTADQVADLLVPAFKLFGEQIPTSAEELDKFTWLVKRSNVDLSDFGTMLTRMAPYMDELNMSLDDAVVTLRALSEQGIQGTAATLTLRTAITQAAREGTSLNEILGISQEELTKYRAEMAEATGITLEYADVANQQYGIIDRLKQKWSELTLSLGSFLTPLEPILAAMTALGPALIFLGTAHGIATLKVIKHTFSLVGHKLALLATGKAITAATIAQWKLNVAMAANPIGLIIIAIAGLITGIIALVRNWETVVTFFRGPAYRATKELAVAMHELADTMVDDVRRGIQTVKTEYEGLLSFMQSMGWEQSDKIPAQQLEQIRKINPELAAQIDMLHQQIDLHDENVGLYEDELQAIRKTWLEQQLAMEDLDRETRIRYQQELDRIKRAETVTRLRSLMREHSQEIITQASLWAKAVEDFFARWEDGWDGTLDQLRHFIVDFNNLVKTGLLDDETIATFHEKFRTLIGMERQRQEAAQPKPASERSFWDMLLALLRGELLTPRALQGVTPFQYGGIVKKPTMGIIGEAGPEAVIPLDQLDIGRTGGDVHIHVGYLVGDELSLNKFAKLVKERIQRDDRRTAFGPVNQGYYYGRSST